MKKSLAVLFFSVTLNGCDTLYGPAIRNELKTDVFLEVFYEDGSSSSGNFPLCYTVFVGKEGRKIKKLLFKIGADVFYQIDSDEIESKLKIDGVTSGKVVVVVDETGTRLSSNDTCNL